MEITILCRCARENSFNDQIKTFASQLLSR
jgi:hypothetical protein